MKKLIIPILLILLIAGSVMASPIDFLIPTPKSPATTEYLGHTNLDNVNYFYHSLSDSKLENKLLEVRKVELTALYQVSKVSNNAIIEMADPISNLAWGGIVLALGAAGIMVPSPGTKKKINDAGATDSKKYKSV